MIGPTHSSQTKFDATIRWVLDFVLSKLHSYD